MATSDRAAGAGRRSMSAVLGVALIQLVVFFATTGFWMGLTFGAGGKCATSCHWAGGQQAALLYFGLAALSFAMTAGATIVSYRTARDLAWVPLIGSAVIVAGYFLAAALFTRAMS